MIKDLHSRILAWCYECAGERKVEWDIWTKLHSGSACANPVTMDIGLKIADNETALAFELAFNVKEISLDEDMWLKYITN